MQKLTFRWQNQEICLSDRSPIILSSLNLGEAYRENISNKNWGSSGVSVVSSKVGARTITARCTLLCKSEKELFDMRKKITSVLNPARHDGTLFYFNGFKEYQIAASVETSIVFEEFLGGRRGQFFTVRFFCKNPLFLEPLEVQKEFRETLPMIIFPLTIKENLVFSSLLGTELRINNRGDAKAGVRIEVFGPVRNPVIENQTTGEKIVLQTNLLEGEKAIITTHFSDKKVVIYRQSGESFNAFHLISSETVFFSLASGINRVRFYGSQGDDLARCKMAFREGYFAA